MGLSPDGPLRPAPRPGGLTCGVLFDDEAGRVWAIPEGEGLPGRALLLLLPNGGRLPGVKLRLPIALPRPPPAGLWEVLRYHALAVHGNLTIKLFLLFSLYSLSSATSVTWPVLWLCAFSAHRPWPDAT